MKKRAIRRRDDDPEFCPAGRLVCRGCGWNADGGPCANCGAVAPPRDFEVQAWRELWGVGCGMRSIAVIVLLALAACNPPSPVVQPPPPPPQPRSCFNNCNSSIECSGIIARCPFCNFGSCSSSRPELRSCLQACAPGVEPRPVWCDFGGCGDVLRAAGAPTSR